MIFLQEPFVGWTCHEHVINHCIEEVRRHLYGCPENSIAVYGTGLLDCSDAQLLKEGNAVRFTCGKFCTEEAPVGIGREENGTLKDCLAEQPLIGGISQLCADAHTA